jgi:hypothetical protein
MKVRKFMIDNPHVSSDEQLEGLIDVVGVLDLRLTGLLKGSPKLEDLTDDRAVILDLMLLRSDSFKAGFWRGVVQSYVRPTPVSQSNISGTANLILSFPIVTSSLQNGLIRPVQQLFKFAYSPRLYTILSPSSLSSEPSHANFRLHPPRRGNVLLVTKKAFDQQE